MDNSHLCRGKRTDNDNWIVGYYTEIPRPIIMARLFAASDHCDWFEVDPATVGRCTGLTAAKSYRGESGADRLIFEGDIINLFDEEVEVCQVKGAYGYRTRYDFVAFAQNPNIFWDDEDDYGIMGATIVRTVHDTPQEGSAEG